MDDTDRPCRDLQCSKQKHLVKGNLTAEETVDNDIKAEKEGPENVAEKETETKSKSGCDVKWIPKEQDGGIRSKYSKQVSDSEEDHNEAYEKLEVGSTDSEKSTIISENVASGKMQITLKRSDGVPSSYISCKEGKSKIAVYKIFHRELQLQAQPQKSNAEGINPQNSFLPSDDVNHLSNNDKNCTINPSENFEVIPKDDIEGGANDEERGCPYCFTEERVMGASSLKRGQHLTVPGYYTRMYRHHCVLVQVVSCSGLLVELEVIHWTKERVGKIEICKTNEKYDLETADLRIIHYKNPKYSPDEVIQRVESELNDFNQGKYTQYCVFSNNCEHLVLWCMSGRRKSFQIQRLCVLVLVVLSSILMLYIHMLNCFES